MPSNKPISDSSSVKNDDTSLPDSHRLSNKEVKRYLFTYFNSSFKINLLSIV